MQLPNYFVLFVFGKMKVFYEKRIAQANFKNIFIKIIYDYSIL